MTLTQSNDFTGPVAVTNTGGNVAITDIGALTLGTPSTVLAVLALASARAHNQSLASIPACAMVAGLEQLNDALMAVKLETYSRKKEAQ